MALDFRHKHSQIRAELFSNFISQAQARTDSRARIVEQWKLSFSCAAAKMWCGKSEASSRVEGMNQERMLELSWQNLFLDPIQWWDNRRSKETPRYPDVKHKTKEALWLKNWYKPEWLKSQLAWREARMVAGLGGTTGPSSVEGGSGRSAADECELEVGSCKDGQLPEAVDALNRLMQKGCHISTAIFYRVLKRCIAHKDLVAGRRIHALIVEGGYAGNTYLATHLIGLYASQAMLEEAMAVFSKVTRPSAHMWASILFAYARHGQPTQALGLYRQMRVSTVKPDNHIFLAALKACATARDLAAGKDVHAHILASPKKPDRFVQNSLVDMYAKCGSLDDARRVFDRLPHRDVVTWNAMIAGYAQQGLGQEALTLYSAMQQEAITPPDSVTFLCLLQACASVGVAALPQGKQLHIQIEEQGLQADVVVGLVDMYVKCGSLEDAQKLFDGLPHKNVGTWTAMIGGYAQHGLCQEALSLYSIMQQEGVTPPNSVTFVCLLQACASVGALPLGKQLHAQIKGRGLQADEDVGRSLVNMYSKCGSMLDSRAVFDILPKRDVVTWGALIAGYSHQADSDVVFDLVERMRQEGIQPDSIVFLSVLTVCSHVGLVDKGRKYFEAMSREYGITRTVEHYTCMVDLLGGAGHLDEALQMVKTMPFQPNGAVWLTLLCACRKWSNVDVGRHAFECAVRLDEKDAAAYVLMSNIYADAQMWEEAQETQARRVKSGAWKQPGQSWWTDMGGVVHEFAVVARD